VFRPLFRYDTMKMIKAHHPVYLPGCERFLLSDAAGKIPTEKVIGRKSA
jgi:hypothetical protein